MPNSRSCSTNIYMIPNYGHLMSTKFWLKIAHALHTPHSNKFRKTCDIDTHIESDTLLSSHRRLIFSIAKISIELSNQIVFFGICSLLNHELDGRRRSSFPFPLFLFNRRDRIFPFRLRNMSPRITKKKRQNLHRFTEAHLVGENA